MQYQNPYNRENFVGLLWVVSVTFHIFLPHV